MNRKVLLFFSLILFLNFVAASFSIGNLSSGIESKYGAGERISGWINLSFQQEPADSRIESSLGGAINIRDLLRLNNNVFTCETTDCVTAYNSQNPENSKVLNMNQGDRKLVGMQFFGEKVRNIQGVNLTVSSNAGSSCSPQIKIDLGDDGIIDYVNSGASGELCSDKNYGCFVNTGLFDDYNIGTTPYCQKINVSESPGFYAGAYVKRGSGTPVLTMRLMDESEFEVDSCELPSMGGNEGEVSCEMNVSVSTPRSYYVCIFADQSTDYKLRGDKNPTNKCGFYGNDVTTLESSYALFLQQKKFAPVGNFVITEDNSNTIAGKISKFFDSKYNFDGIGYNCSGSCTFPISIKSQSTQQISFLNLNVEYDKSGGRVSETKFYDVSKNSPKISSSYQKIGLDKANFTVPSSIGNSTLILKIGSQEILNQRISVEDTPSIDYLYPLKTAVNFPTDFIVSVNNRNRTIVKYEGNFGDGNSVDTKTTNKETHTYNDTKNYTLIVRTIDDKSFTSSKSFQIEVGSAKDKINETLFVEKKKLERLKVDLENMPVIFKDNFYSALNLTVDEDEIKRIERGYATASTENTYFNLLQDLLKIDLPESINITEKADNVFFVPPTSSINVEDIADIAGGKPEGVGSEDVLKWLGENVEMKVNYKEYSKIYGNRNEKLLKTFVLNVKPKQDYSYDTYIFFQDLDNLKFEGEVNDKGKSDKNLVYIPLLEEKEKSVTFSTTSDVDFTNLRVYVSPSLDKLPVSGGQNNLVCNADKKCGPGETWKNCSDCKPTGIIVLAVFILIIIALGGYFLLYRWYNTKYEKSLFKNQNDLYNIINYIHGSKAKGLKEEEMIRNLKKSGWSGEQVAYAVKRYGGKRIGLWSPFNKK